VGMRRMQLRSLKICSVDRISEVVARDKRRAVFPIVCADHCAWLTHSDFEDTVTDPGKLARVIEHAYVNYDYDMVLLFTDAYVEAEAMGCPVRLSPFPTLIGPRYSKTVDRTNIIVEAARILKSKLPVPVFVSIKGPFSLASFLAGIKELLILVLKDPPAAQDLIQESLEFQLSYLDRLLVLGVHVFIGDPLASASVISPDIFLRYAYNPLKTLVAKIKNRNSLVGIHVCGDTVPIIEQLDSIGADILSVENMDVLTRTVKMGGISTTTIRYGPREKIAQEINATGKEPYLILSTSCDVPVDTPPDNIRYMVAMRHDQGNG
jgi:MtaA/CmuA family methyltransferase